MAVRDPDEIFKALRPVPEFDGNPNVLTRFIKICDSIIYNYLGTSEESVYPNLCLINGILNKITGPAARFINSNGIPETWAGIRTALINNFSDQRDETALYNDLALLTQGSSTPQEFYEKCQQLFSTIMTYVSLHENISTTIEAKRALYKKLTMQAYVRGLREPLGSRIRCMRPDSIEKALEYVQEELNATYLQSRNNLILDKGERRQIGPRPAVMSSSLQGHNAFNNSFMPNNFIPRPRPPPQQFPRQPQPIFQLNPQQPRMQTRTQQMFRALPPNYNPRSNVFRLPNRTDPHGPKPMSGVSHYVTKELPPTPNNFQEMNLHEIYPYEYYNNYNVDSPSHYAYDGSYYECNNDAYYDSNFTHCTEPLYFTDYDEYAQHYSVPENSNINYNREEISSHTSPGKSEEDFQEKCLAKKPK